MGNGIEGGSSIFQTIWNGYSQVAQQATGQLVTDILPVVAATVIGCLQLLVLISGTNLLYGKLDAGEAARRIVTALVVSALMTAAVFNQYITTTLTQTIPNEITQAIVNGANGATGATGFDSLMNEITHSAAAARAQMPFPFYISERVGLWIAELACKIFIAFSFIVWALSALTVYFLVPLLAFLAPTFLFNATRSYGERWAGKIIALILAQTIALMTAAVVISQEGRWFQQMAQNVTASANANLGFSMNAGDLNFGEFALGAPNPVAPGQNATINTDYAVETMMGMCVSLIVGFMLLAATTSIAYGIGGGGGWNSGPVVNRMIAITTVPAKAAAGAATAAAGRALGARK
jgi:type IV secretory pathway VirB6-like protein